MHTSSQSKINKNITNYDYPLQRNPSNSRLDKQSPRKLKKTFDAIKSEYNGSENKKQHDVIISQYIKEEHEERE